MLRAVVVVMALVVCLFAHAGLDGPKKPEPEKKQPAPTTRITPEKLSGKPGKLLVIDAKAASGDVIWDFDEKMFDVDSAEVDGKKLRLVMPAMGPQAQVFVVVMFSKDPFVKERVYITLPGTDEPGPVDPTQTPIQQLMKMVKQIQLDVTSLTKTVKSIDDRVTALEKLPVPPDPTPKPNPTPVAEKLFILVFYDKALKDNPRIIDDLEYWNGLTEQGHGWRKIDIKNPDAKPWMPYIAKGPAGPVMVIDNRDNTKWLATVPVPNVGTTPEARRAAFDEVVKKYTGAK